MTLPEVYHFGPFVLDAARRRLEREGAEVALQPKVFSTLLYLLRHPRRVVPKEELLAALWPDTFVTENVLARSIKELRRALGDDAHHPSYLRTAPRVGYEVVAEVRLGAAAGAPAGSQMTSIAVLPFRPVVAEDRDEGLELGMADTLIARLSTLRRVVVRPFSAVRRYAGLDQDPLAAGREQGVEAVVEGSLRRVQDRLRVTVRVLRVSDAAALFSESFDQPFSDVFRVQDAACQRITDALAVELTAVESRKLERRATLSLAAYRLYLLGRLRAGRHTVEDDRRSIELFQQAVEEDPGFAMAWAGLADAWDSLGTLETSADHFEAARRCAARALELDADLAPALTCLGKIAWEHDWNWGAADRYFRRALEAAPGDAGVHIAFSDYCGCIGRHEDALAAAGRALEIDPTSAWVGTLLAQALHMSGMHDDAIAQAHRTLEVAPDFAFAHFFLGLSSALQRRFEVALEHLERARDASGRTDFAAVVGWAFGVAGRRSEALAALHELEARPGTPPFLLAIVLLGLGEEERALDFFERAASDRDWHVLLLRSEPMFRRLRPHPRTSRLLAQLQLPP